MQEKNIKYKLEMFDRGELEAMYYRQKLAVKEIALAYRVSANTMKKILVAHKFKFRTKGEQASISLTGYKRDKEFKQKLVRWYENNEHHNKGKVFPKKRKDPYKKQCPNCKISFITANWRRKFCSQDCFHRYGFDQKTRKKISNTWKEKLKEPHKKRENLQRIFDGISVKPNHPERVLITLFKKLGLSYKYVGDYSYWIENRNPDFVDYDGNKIIEMFGIYWHSPEEIPERKSLFKRYGYDTLIIWDYELKNMGLVTQKIKAFEET